MLLTRERGTKLNVPPSSSLSTDVLSALDASDFCHDAGAREPINASKIAAVGTSNIYSEDFRAGRKENLLVAASRACVCRVLLRDVLRAREVSFTAREFSSIYYIYIYAVD